MISSGPAITDGGTDHSQSGLEATTDMSGGAHIPGAECPRIHSRSWVAYGQIRRKVRCERPPISEPISRPVSPAASVAAEPPEEPPGIRS